MTREKLLIVDDEKDMLEGVKRLLGYELENLEVETAWDPKEAVELAGRRLFDMVLLDVRMPGMDGLAVLNAMRRRDPLLTCVMMTAHGTIELAVEAMKAGAYDFITKPFEKETLIRVIEKGLERNRLIRENRVLKRRVEKHDFHGMIGRGSAMRRLFERISAVARSDYSVLVRGESGTGKELVARAVHAESLRNTRNFVVVNCPAIPEHLLESELFGHRRGAFTGAERDQRGLFAEADGGTIFLDEVADIPVSVQTKLLRVLQEGEIKPLGSVKPATVDVRVIAATNQNLEEKIRERKFREDLFYRLNVVTLKTPDLGEAREDIPLLANHFARVACKELKKPPVAFSPGSLKLLSLRQWPGNVRQLQNVVRQAIIFAEDEIVEPEELKIILEEFGSLPACEPRAAESPSTRPSAGGVEPYREAKDRALDKFTRDYVDRLLAETDGNITKGARLSGLGRPSLQKIMRRMDIDPERYR